MEHLLHQLTPVEEGRLYQRLASEGLCAEAIAWALEVSVQQVRFRLALVDLAERKWNVAPLRPRQKA